MSDANPNNQPEGTLPNPTPQDGTASGVAGKYPELEEHPNLVVDKQEAEHMAYASKDSEEAFAEKRKEVWEQTDIMTANHPETPYPEDQTDDEKKKMAIAIEARAKRDELLAEAKNLRRKADSQARIASDTYRELKY